MSIDTIATPAATTEAAPEITIKAEANLLGLFLDYLDDQGHEAFRRWLRENEMAEDDEHLAVSIDSEQNVVTMTLERTATRPTHIGETPVQRLRTVEVQRNWISSRPDQADYEIPLDTPTHRIEEVACAEARRQITDADLSSVEVYHIPEVDPDQSSADEFAGEIANRVGANAEISMLYDEEAVKFTVCWKEPGDYAAIEAELRELNDDVYGYDLDFEHPATA